MLDAALVKLYNFPQFPYQVLRHEEFEEGCKAACNGYDTWFLNISFRL